MGHYLKEIYEYFEADGTFHDGEPYGSGHIHDTFRIRTAEAEKDDYILQRLNNRIDLDAAALVARVLARDPDPLVFLENWVPPGDDRAHSVAADREWLAQSLANLRGMV